MEKADLKSIAGRALRLNLIYYSSLFKVTRDYLTALPDIVKGGMPAASNAGARPYTDKAAAAQPPSSPSVSTIPPLVLAAANGETAEVCFAVTNNTGGPVTACPEISPPLHAAGARAEPAARQMENGETGIFRLRVGIGSHIQPDADITGRVWVPVVGDRDIPVILRRLPDCAPVSKEKPSPARAGNNTNARNKSVRRKPAGGKNKADKT